MNEYERIADIIHKASVCICDTLIDSKSNQYAHTSALVDIISIGTIGVIEAIEQLSKDVTKDFDLIPVRHYTRTRKKGEPQKLL